MTLPKMAPFFCVLEGATLSLLPPLLVLRRRRRNKPDSLVSRWPLQKEMVHVDVVFVVQR